jgi:hypothetical protein
VALLLLSGCGAHDASTANAPASDLQAQLYKELKALGKDPSQTTTEAPTKDDDTVFDLSAVLLDGNGQPLPPGSPGVSGVRLSWTERLTGDYDQNGEVNAGDLAPLAQHLQAAVQYDPASQHGGFAFWPTGDADGAGATNWRLARIDGDGNGLTNAADITPIAKHWKEALQGYRVYRKAPSDASFTRVPDPNNAADTFTVPKPAPPQPGQLVPVRYSFTDSQATAGNLGAGVYEFYVAPYDAGSKQEGISSFAVSVDITTGTVNHAPTARLAVTPALAGAPAVVTLDGSASSDIDGAIAAYQWDLDGDGTVDYASTDPTPPAQSSGGTVDNIAVTGTGKLSATYAKGSAAYYHPRLTVVDNQGAVSPPASAQLGISGWDYEIVSSYSDSFVPKGDELKFNITDLEQDPATAELVATGYTNEYAAYDNNGPTNTIFFARRSTLGLWSVEEVDRIDSQFWKDAFPNSEIQLAPLCVGWQPNAQPMLTWSGEGFTFSSVKVRPMYATRDVAGHWQVAFIPTTGLKDQDKNASAISINAPLLDGTKGLAAIGAAGEESSDEDLYIFWFNEGQWQIEDTGVILGSSTGLHSTEANRIYRSATGTYVIPLTGYPNTPFSLAWLRRVAPGNWQVERLDDGTLDNGDGQQFFVENFTFTGGDTPEFETERILGQDNYLNQLYSFQGTSLSAHTIDLSSYTGGNLNLNYSTLGTTVTFFHNGWTTPDGNQEDRFLVNQIVKNNATITERFASVLPNSANTNTSISLGPILVLPTGAMWAVVPANGMTTISESSSAGIQALMHRVDPTLNQ